MKYVYKIVAALGSLAIIPTIVFIKMIYFKMSSTALSAIFYLGQYMEIDAITNALEGNNGTLPQAISDVYSLYDLYYLFASEGNSDTSEILDKLAPLITPAILCAVILVLIAVVAIITAIFAIAKKNNRYVIYSSICGIGLSFMFNECFEDLAAPILNGTVSLATLLGSTWAGLIGKFEEFSLLSNFWFVPAIFGAVILWTVLYNFTLPEDEKRERKLMLGEADGQ